MVCFLDRIDKVWKQWQEFHDDYLRITEWLDDCEKETRQPQTQGAKFAVMKAELFKYDVCFATFVKIIL